MTLNQIVGGSGVKLFTVIVAICTRRAFTNYARRTVEIATDRPTERMKKEQRNNPVTRNTSWDTELI